MNEKNKNPTFAEKLKEHSQFLKETSEKFEELNLQMSKATKDGNDTEYERLLAQGEEMIKLSEDTEREFEKNHGKELRVLMQVLKRNELPV